VTAAPDILYYSSIANPDARTISWTDDGTDSGAGYIPIEQEDGGGAITALEKVPGYLLIFKERSLKRWDGNSTYPDDLINVGVASQEAVCRGRGMVFIANQQGVWVTNGGYPQRISKAIQDMWDVIPAANIDDIATFCDENYVYAYVGDLTVDGNTLNNVCFKYNIDSQTWDVYSYYNEFTCFTWYIDSSKKVIVGGDKNGQALKLNSGNTDYHSTVQPITYTIETQDLDFGSRGRIKEITELLTYTQNIRTGSILYRANSLEDKAWKSIRNITQDVEQIDNFKARGNWFNFKVTGASDSGSVKFQGFEFPVDSVNIIDNVHDK
jgi:hypothetical protein